MTTTAADVLAACQDEATSLFILGAIENQLHDLDPGEWHLANAAMHAGIAGTLLALQQAGMLGEQS